MKAYMTPEMEVVEFSVEDILTTSKPEESSSSEWTRPSGMLPPGPTFPDDD